jgi:hypothetical protein
MGSRTPELHASREVDKGHRDFHPLPGMGDPQCTSPVDESEAS